MYNNVHDALKHYEATSPDIIISDISMPGMSGIESIKKFKEKDSSVKIILISVHDEINFVLNSIENKVDGYLTKPISKDGLLHALESVEQGGIPLTPDISKLLVKLVVDKKDDLFSKNDLFSEREIEILKLFTTGHTYKSMAETLFISHSTVNFHIQNIYSKLDVNNKSDALIKLKNTKI
ncbi:hypothetical protein GCM10022291_16890 [Postechiella marina]|uniref:DNA-binding response regulator n=2 Tax=Postechiella marina TaxID=943941 RepID=A0ABP8C853_9FLAO